VAKAAAESFVRDVPRPPVPIREIVEGKGVDVEFVRFGTLGRQIAGLTKFDENKIYVNAEDAFNRQTFTIAHEFGHWVLHKSLFLEDPDRYQVLLRTPKGRNTNPLEKEANCFAANILVPTRLLRPVKGIASKSELARMFAVSEETIEHRLKYV
jgi:Zn-dependent peptidase ImmA (M78 family)